MIKAPQTPQEQLKARAESRFKVREAQKAEAPTAVREYRDAQDALHKKTARLRAARLARDAKLSP